MIALLLAAAASAQDDPMEVVVWGELAVAQAHDALVRELESLGYRAVKRRGGEVVMRPPSDWMGRLRVSPEGELDFGRPVLGLSPLPPEAYTDDPRHGAADVRVPETEVGVGPTFWLLPSSSRLGTRQREVMERTEDEQRTLGAVRERTRLQTVVEELPGRLDALWRDGTPLAPGPTVATPEERRAAVLEFWATRADDPAGRFVLDAVDPWIASVLWVESPPTAEELVIWDARRADGRVLPRP